MADQRRESEHRPSPEALLEAARREERRVGKLRIFVGAAPGVGKTYEMLQQAHAPQEGRLRRRRRHRRDPRPQGDRSAARGPRSRSAPARRIQRPVARTRWTSTPSSPGIRRSCWSTSSPTPTPKAAAIPKRYLDVEELMSHGIDVYTTVNIQHIESLNDVVAQITHVRVRETVPDAVFDRADAVELVDLTPDDLIQRLKEGKVYVPKQAERALEHFFSPANLTALRELALAPHRRAGRRAIAHGNAGARHPGPVGGRRAHPGLHQRGSALPPAWCATPSGSPTACMGRGRRSTSRAGAACSSPRRSATASPTRCGSPRRSAAKPSRYRPATATSPTT